MWTGVSFFRKVDDCTARPVPAAYWLIVSGFVSPYVSAESEVTEAGPIECIFGPVGVPEDFGLRKENRKWTLSPGPCICLCECSTTELHPRTSLTGSYKTIIFGIQNYMVYSLLSPLGGILAIP